MGWCSPHTVYFLLPSSLSIYIINEISKKVKTYFKRILYTLLLYFNAMKRAPARPNVCSYKKRDFLSLFKVYLFQYLSILFSLLSYFLRLRLSIVSDSSHGVVSIMISIATIVEMMIAMIAMISVIIVFISFLYLVYIISKGLTFVNPFFQFSFDFFFSLISLSL